MQIVDLRQLHSRSLDILFQEEARHWREELYWDYRPSIELIRKFIDSRALGGYAALENGHPHRLRILRSRRSQRPDRRLVRLLAICAVPGHQKLLAEMLGALRATPRLQRIEAQLMPFGTELDPIFLSQYFRLVPAPVHGASAGAKQISPASRFLAGLRIEPWSDRAFEAAARLIHLAYADHVDSQINDQYCSEAGGLKFLRNIVLLARLRAVSARSFLPGSPRGEMTA